ncbi:MAG: DUF4307 domain-containing protein [Actinobacteria bacterium]|nr:DUF4307 domain-containing protein [Actinomycetota bacterium]
MIDVRTLSPEMQQRYGVKKQSRLALIGIGLLIAVFVAASAATAWQLANPPVRSKLLTWSVNPEYTSVTWEIRRSPEAEVVCVIRVADANRHDVGYATVTIPPGAAYEQPSYDVRTRAPGRVVELLGCAAGKTPAVPAPEFPPGTENPPQPWTPEEPTP